MKRQTKPFAVEIKRSRRSTPLNEISPHDVHLKKITCPEPVKPSRLDIKILQSIDRQREDADLKIPIFLQGSKEAPRPQTEHELAAASLDSSFWKLNKDEGGSSAVQQISSDMPLMPEAGSIEVKPPKKAQVRLTRLAFTGVPQHNKTNATQAAVASEISGDGSQRSDVFERSVADPHSQILQTDEVTPDTTLSRPKRRAHRFLKVDRESAASLPPGQRWKRRLLSRAR